MHTRHLAAAVAVLSLGLGFEWPRSARAEGALVIKQGKAPVEVLSYATEYDEDDGKHFVYHTIKYQNTSDKDIQVAKFGVLELDVFGDLLDTFMGYTLEESDKGEKDKAKFANEKPSSVLFETHGTGLVWVEAVRFADGVVWKADRAQVLEGMRKLRSQAAEADLQEKKSLREE